MFDGLPNSSRSFRGTDPVRYKDDVPAPFHTDFAALAKLHCKEIGVYTYRSLGLSLHTAFILVMDDGRLYLAEGGPTKTPRPQSAFRMTARDILSHFGVGPRYDMGYMMPHIAELKPRGAHAFCSDIEKEEPGTMHFREIVPGRGLGGITFFKRPGSRFAKISLLAGPNAQPAYEEILRIAHVMAADHMAYELVPSFAHGTANCHTFTEMVLTRLQKDGLLTAADMEKFYRFASEFRFGLPGTSGGGFHTGIARFDRLMPPMPAPAMVLRNLKAYRRYKGEGSPPPTGCLMPYSRPAPAPA